MVVFARDMSDGAGQLSRESLDRPLVTPQPLSSRFESGVLPWGLQPMSDMQERIASLSPRQREVMQLVARRLSSKEIAQLLGLSPATVDSHIAAVLQRMQVESRREAARHFVDSGYAGLLPSVGESPDVHHGGDRPPESSTMAESLWARIVGRSQKGTGDSRFPGGADGSELPPRKRRMGAVFIRFFLDAVYILAFFLVMSGAAYGAHLVVILCEQQNIDRVVLVILRGVSYMLAGLGAIGVVSATGILTYRFVRAIYASE
jgi:DNA-binding CsgD family transcriptional regulator